MTRTVHRIVTPSGTVVRTAIGKRYYVVHEHEQTTRYVGGEFVPLDEPVRKGKVLKRTDSAAAAIAEFKRWSRNTGIWDSRTGEWVAAQTVQDRANVEKSRAKAERQHAAAYNPNRF